MKKSVVFTLIVGFVMSFGLTPAQAESQVIEIQLKGNSVAVTNEAGDLLDSKLDISNEPVLVSEEFGVEVGKHSSDSLQLLISIESLEAPRSYEFRVPGVVRMEELTLGRDKLYRLVGAANDTIGWLGKPWAKDANGQEVSTNYTFDAGVITQFVNIDQPGITFPVQADPYLGKSLISSVKSVWTNNSYYALSVAVSLWMWDLYVVYTKKAGIWGYTTAYQISVSYGWDEVLTKFAAKNGLWFRDYIVTKPTFEDQWDCHSFGAGALFAGAIFGTDPHPTWDLEGFRSHVQDAAVWISSNCSWN